MTRPVHDNNFFLTLFLCLIGFSNGLSHPVPVAPFEKIVDLAHEAGTVAEGLRARQIYRAIALLPPPHRTYNAAELQEPFP